MRHILKASGVDLRPEVMEKATSKDQGKTKKRK